jgi:hypothetical protein
MMRTASTRTTVVSLCSIAPWRTSLASSRCLDLYRTPAELHVAHDDGEQHSFAEAEGHAAWRAVMQLKMGATERNGTWDS